MIEPQNPLDIRPDDLADLIADVRALAPQYDVQIGYFESKGYGVTLWEVMHIYVEWKEVTAPATTALVAVAVKWMKERFKKNPTRPKVVTIWGPNGEALKIVTMKTADQEPEYDTQVGSYSPRNRPPVR